EVRPKLSLSGMSERHVVSHDLELSAVLDNRCQGVVGPAWLDGIVQLDVRQLGSADDSLLLLDRQLVPSRQVVQVLLDDDVTAAGEGGILVADDGGVGGRLPYGVLRAVDESDQVARVEIAEAVNLVDRGDDATEPRHDLRLQFEAQIHAPGTDVEEDVARRGDCVMPPADFTERMQLLRPRRAKEPVPHV